MNGSSVWRDRTLALACWAAVTFMAAHYWAAPVEPPSTIAQEPATARAAPLAISAALPVVLMAVNATPWGARARSHALRVFQRPLPLALLSTALAALIGSDLVGIGAPGPARELAITVVVALLLLWHFYRRQAVNTQLLLATGSWLLILIISRSTLRLFPGRVDIFAASWRTRSLFLVHASVFLLACVSPLIVVLPEVRLKLSRLDRIPRGLVLWPIVLFGAAAFASWFVLQTGLAEPFRTLLVLRTTLLLMAAHSLLISPTLAQAPPREAQASMPDVSFPLYVGLWVLIAAFFLALAVVINFNQLEHLNPDGIAYLTIARSYAEGQPVVRGSWSPLVSWLDAVLIRQGFDARVGFRLILVTSALLVVLLTGILGRRFGLSRLSSLLAGAAMGLIVLSNGGFNPLTPDLLGAALMSIYFWWTSRPEVPDRPVRDGAVAGLLGALAYYAKYYNLIFVSVHILSTALLLTFRRKSWRSPAIMWAAGTGSILVAALPWIAALSARYGSLTFTTTARFSGPTGDHPCWKRQLCNHPTDVLFPWEDPDPRYVPAWSPLNGVDAIRYQIKLTKGNLWNWVGSMRERLGPLPLLALAACAAGALTRWENPQLRVKLVWLLATMGLYFPGYMLTYALDFRYYYAILPLMLIAVFMVLRWLALRISVFGLGSRAAGAVALAILMLPPFTLIRWDTLREDLVTRIGPCGREGAQELAPLLVAPMAGFDRQVNFISYFTRVRTFGVLPAETPPAEADSQLRNLGVRTLLAWKGSDLATALTSQFGYATIGTGAVCGVDYEILRPPP